MKKILLIALLAVSVFANELYIAAGAGYKRPLSEIAGVFEKESGIKINPMFGNMQQISEQMKNSDKISIFFGDDDFIKKLKIEYSDKIELGRGILVLVFAKNDKNLKSIEDLKSESVKKIGLPDTTKAIYGIAADEFLKNSKLKESLKDKINVFQTVPQVSSYLVSGDIEAGFINKTDYLGIADKVGAAVEIDSSQYSSIKIVGVVLKGKESKESKALFDYLKTPKAKELLIKHGL